VTAPEFPRLVLPLSFGPLAVKAVGYVTIGSYVPLLVFCLFGGLVLCGGLGGPRARRITIRVWATALVLWAVTRLGLSVLLLSTDIGEVHPKHQVTAWYFALTVAHLALGIWLFRRSGPTGLHR